MEYKITRLKDDELMHYGVLGMRWGYRKSPERTARKVREFSEHYERKLKRSKKSDNRVLKGRQKQLAKMENKIKKYKQTTEYMKKGREAYNDIIKKRMETKIKSLTDPSYKKTFAYKNARINYVKQWINDQKYMSSSEYTKWHYADLLEKGKSPKI